jgi:uncharacterized protein YlxW (UPF0749 family)
MATLKTEDVMIGVFIARWDDAADGVMMDADTAQALARAFKRMEAATKQVETMTMQRDSARELLVIETRRRSKAEDDIRDFEGQVRALTQQVETLTAALRSIQSEVRRDDVRLVHLRRCIAAQIDAALKETNHGD